MAAKIGENHGICQFCQILDTQFTNKLKQSTTVKQTIHLSYDIYCYNSLHFERFCWLMTVLISDDMRLPLIRL